MKKLLSNFANNQILEQETTNEGATTGNKTFFSYGTKIAEFKKDKIYLSSEHWNHSRTTLKYLCEFLGVQGKKDIEAGIKSKLYLLTTKF